MVPTVKASETKYHRGTHIIELNLQEWPIFFSFFSFVGLFWLHFWRSWGDFSQRKHNLTDFALKIELANHQVLTCTQMRTLRDKADKTHKRKYKKADRQFFLLPKS